MVVLDVARTPSRRSAPAAPPAPSVGPLRVRTATVPDAERTAAIELLGAGVVTRMFPALVRWQHRIAVTHPGSVALLAERRAVGGRTEVAGYLAGTRRGVVDLLVTDDGPAPEATARALLAAYRAWCTAHTPGGRSAEDAATTAA
jgi:hypothetical protein